MRRALVLASAALLLADCGLSRYTERSIYTPAARAWVLASEVSERPVRDLVAGARVLGLGEAAHGAREVFLARAELTRRLIVEGWARTLILETDVWDACALDRYVRGEGDDVRGALAAVIGLYQHDSERFFRWLRDHNREVGAAGEVRLRGMDAQWLHACEADDGVSCPGRARYCEQARALRQAPELGDTYFGRDEIMAANVFEFARESPGGTIVWAHSGHVSRSSPLLFNGQWSQTAPMGWFLARALGEEYVPMTVSFGRGVVSVTSLRGVG